MRRRKTSQQPNLKAVRTVVLGKDGVGKSALIVRFLTRRFITEYDQTLESTWRHHMEVDSEYIYVDLMDTAGENSQTKLDGCLPGGDIFLVLYSITDRASFEEATRIGRHIRERVKTNSTSPMLILIGTKRDLGHLRKVDETEGSDLSGELNCPFYEISVSCCDGYKEVSDMLRGSIRQFLENGKNGSQTDKRNQSSSLLKMKEGFIKRRGSFRKKSASL
ncbi:ras-related and estrogen-regulated growth inhibitor-like [Montipora capricornis]|uniref:ras-related and estrogen-regulated growth inhibitor-like n=1 Tax=Montipora capricornis TaxID=246305 RepID=UPI0035F1474D